MRKFIGKTTFLAASTSAIALTLTVGMAQAQGVSAELDALKAAPSADEAQVLDVTPIAAEPIEGDEKPVVDAVDVEGVENEWRDLNPKPDAIDESENDIEATAEVLRSLPENMDPVSAEEVRRLDQMGILTRQKEVGEDIIIIDREMRRAESTQKLIELMGVDGFKRSFPSLYDLMKDSPIMIQAEILGAELKHQLDIAKIPPDQRDKKEVEEQKPRDDGSSFFEMPVKEEEVAVVPPPEVPAEPAIEVVQPIIEVPISLREVYGIGTNYFAIIIHGTERIRVSAGDELPGNTQIISIGEGYIDLIRNGREMRIRIQG